MQKLIIPVLLGLFVLKGYAQNDFQDRFNQAYALKEQKRFSEALQAFNGIVRDYPAYAVGHILKSWCLLNTGGDLQQASYHADMSVKLDPYNQASFSIQSYVAYATGRPDAEELLKTALWMSADEEALPFFIQDFDDLIAAGLQPKVFQSLKTTATRIFQTRDRSFVAVSGALARGGQALGAGNFDQAVSNFREAMRLANFPAQYRGFRALTAYACGNFLTNYQRWDDALLFYEQALQESGQYREVTSFTKTIILSRLADSYLSAYDGQKAFALLSPNTGLAMGLPNEAIFEKMYFYYLLCRAEITINNWLQLFQHATTLKSLAETLGDPGYIAAAYNMLGVAQQGDVELTARQNALRNFEKGLSIAQGSGLDGIVIDIKSNLFILKYNLGYVKDAFAIRDELVDFHLRNKDYIAAETIYNNFGAMCYAGKRYDDAINTLQKAIDIVERYRDQYTGETKLNFIARSVSAYQFMSATAAEMKDPGLLFKIQNMERGRLLATMLNNATTPQNVTLAEFQQTLKEDEAALVYTSLEAGVAIINVVRRGSAFPIRSRAVDQFFALKKNYLDRYNGNGKKPGYRPARTRDVITSKEMELELDHHDFDDMMSITRDLMPKSYEPLLTVRNDFLRAYYDLLIKPVLPQIAGVKKLIIMPDGLLNFLPFEALLSANGKYLVQQFDIRYSQSAQVKSIIEQRSYPNRPKGLLAMGGAEFFQMRETSEQIFSTEQLVTMQNLAAQNLAQNRSQRKIYAALGFGKLNYLQGSLDEVKAIKPLFGENADLFTGSQMTEKQLKSLAASGQLKNYKVIHLATHGFAIPQIPQLSGIAMSIYPDPRDGEDGYLTAPEVARLGMQADLVVLSACETGLGKIYGGEGVAGLTQSLLVGGANRAIVSLWPVSDLGTQHFMTGLYRLTQIEGKSYDEAVNEMKRKFIAGEFGPEFQSPDIWAPFVHYGK